MCVCVCAPAFWVYKLDLVYKQSELPPARSHSLTIPTNKRMKKKTYGPRVLDTSRSITVLKPPPQEHTSNTGTPKNCLYQLQKQADICNGGCDVTHKHDRLATTCDRTRICRVTNDTTARGGTIYKVVCAERFIGVTEKNQRNWQELRN